MNSILPAAPAAKTAILTEALKLFASRGVEAVSVRDIAAASGFSNPALFRHFRSKEELATTLFESAYRRLANAICAPGAQKGLQPWLAAAFGEIERSPEGAHFVFSTVDVYWKAMPGDLRGRSLHRIAKEMVDRARAEGTMRQNLDVTVVVSLLIGALSYAARSAHFRDEGRPSQGAAAAATALSSALSQGLGVKSGRRRS